MDISADLTELGRTPVAVVCAGVKSILDIGRTLEYLETQGVSVVTVGGNGEFPAFFTRTSGHRVSMCSERGGRKRSQGDPCVINPPILWTESLGVPGAGGGGQYAE